MGPGVVRGSIPRANEPPSRKEEFEARAVGASKLRFHRPHASARLRGT